MKTLKQYSKYAGSAFALMMLTGSAFAAESMGDIGVRVGETISTWTTVVFLLSAMIGLALCISSTLNIKKYSDNPQQNSWTKGAIYFLAGSLCFFLAYSTGVMQKTLFNEDSANSGQDYEFTREAQYNGS